MIEKCFSQVLDIKEAFANFFVGINSAERINYLVPSTVFQFKKFEEPKFFVIL